MASETNCHSRWCPAKFQASPDCTNVAFKIEELFPDSGENPLPTACCKLWCGKRSQLLQLQCMGTSERMAIVIWFMVAVLVLCAAIQLVSVLGKGECSRKVAMFGGPLFLAFIAVIVYLVTDKHYVYVDTPFYPIVGAMNVAAFSYYFSSFQYSISLPYELASAIALVFTMFPLWTLLTVKMKTLEALENSYEDHKIREIAVLVLAMLMLSILWNIHSSLYRTVGYRAAWITAFKKQVAEGQEGKNFMSKLRVLAGAQGHPTWRTPAGQSIGLYLAVLSWVVSVSTYNYLQRSCKDDLILFHILLWVPPVILTMAVLVTQVIMCMKASSDFQGNDNLQLSQWFTTKLQPLWQTDKHKHVKEAVISYRLGRDTLEVEDPKLIEKFQIKTLDKFLAGLVLFIENATFWVAYPGSLVLGILQGLGICIKLKCTSRIPGAAPSSPAAGIPKPSSPRPPIDFEKFEAYRTLCEHCLSADSDDYLYYGSLGRKFPYFCCKAKQRSGQEALTDDKMIDEKVCQMFRNQRRMIRLPLLLDNIGPSCLTYLLEKLVDVMNNNIPEPPRGLREGSSDPIPVNLEGGSPNGRRPPQNGTRNQEEVPLTSSASSVSGDQQLLQEEPATLPYQDQAAISRSRPESRRVVPNDEIEVSEVNSTDTTTVQALTNQHLHSA